MVQMSLMSMTFTQCISNKKITLGNVLYVKEEDIKNLLMLTKPLKQVTENTVCIKYFLTYTFLVLTGRSLY